MTIVSKEVKFKRPIDLNTISKEISFGLRQRYFLFFLCEREKNTRQ